MHRRALHRRADHLMLPTFLIRRALHRRAMHHKAVMAIQEMPPSTILRSKVPVSGFGAKPKIAWGYPLHKHTSSPEGCITPANAQVHAPQPVARRIRGKTCPPQVLQTLPSGENDTCPDGVNLAPPAGSTRGHQLGLLQNPGLVIQASAGASKLEMPRRAPPSRSSAICEKRLETKAVNRLLSSHQVRKHKVPRIESTTVVETLAPPHLLPLCQPIVPTTRLTRCLKAAQKTVSPILKPGDLVPDSITHVPVKPLLLRLRPVRQLAVSSYRPSTMVGLIGGPTPLKTC